MKYHDKRREIRTNDEIEDRVLELLEERPDLYKTASDVYRAGIMVLHREKKEVAQNVVEKKKRIL